MDFYKGVIPIISDDPATTDLAHPLGATYGYVERDYQKYPETMFAHPDEMSIIPESDWDAWYDEQEAKRSSLEHIFLEGGKPAFINLDQDGAGYCWSYSTGHSIMMKRLSK